MIEELKFYKITGGGNDFLLVVDLEDKIPPEAIRSAVPKICHRQLSAGADGFILLKPSSKAHFRWYFFNSDGSEAEMCGNGGRCAARLAYMLGIAPEELSFETRIGIVKARVNGRNVKIELPPPRDLKVGIRIGFEDKDLVLDFVNTGVPHTVLFVEDLDGLDVKQMGRAIRWHERFSPEGTNVNFVKVESGYIRVRTYERGVEDETLACGTGSIASALIAFLKGHVQSPTKVVPKSGEPLTVYYSYVNGTFRDIALEGEVRLVYEGIFKEALW